MRLWQQAALALLLAAAAPLGAAGPEWRSAAERSGLEFFARYEGEEIPGRFARFTVRLTTDAAGVEPASLTVEVDTGSADMNDGEINQELAEPEWFDTADFPSARFEGGDIVRSGDGYLAHGRLRIKDIERPLDVPFTWRSDGGSGVLAGTVDLSRLAWGVGAGEWATDARLADRVRVRFDVRMQPAD